MSLIFVRQKARMNNTSNVVGCVTFSNVGCCFFFFVKRPQEFYKNFEIYCKPHFTIHSVEN